MFGHSKHGVALFTAALLLAVSACTETVPTDGAMDVEVDAQAAQVASPTQQAYEAGEHQGPLPQWGQMLAVGDNVHDISGGFSQPCSIQTGIAFDGTNLIMSCWSHNTLDILDPSTGALVGTLTMADYNGFGAMAWNRSTGTLWACGNGGVAGFMSDAVEIDMSTGTVVSSFPVGIGECTDGLAYDGTDNTLWTSGDVHSELDQWQLDGTHLQTVSVSGKLGGYGSSGIAIGATSFYLANNGGSAIYEADRTFSTFTPFASFPRRIEDLECDDVTFAPDHAVIWQQDAYDRLINAFEIQAGECPFGGGGGAIEVEIDIKPGSWPNSINTRSKKGLTPVAVLGSDAFDPSVLDPTTITLGDDDGDDTPVAARKNGSLHAEMEDVNGDGYMDLVLHFSTPALVDNGDLDEDTESLVLNGEDADGQEYRGEDAVRVVPSK